MAFEQDKALNTLWYSSSTNEVPDGSDPAGVVNGAVAVNTTNGNMWVKVTGGGVTGSWELIAGGGGGGGGTMSSFTLSGDGGSNQTIADGNTLEIAGGVGIVTTGSSTDTITVDIDTTVTRNTVSQTLTNKTLTTPTIASFTNATHDHADAAGGGALGTISVAGGGTGATSLTAGYVLLGSGTSAITPLNVTAKGSLLVGDGSGDPRALAVGGTNTHVLTVDSSEATGLKWAAGSGSGTVSNNSVDYNQVAYYATTGTTVSPASTLRVNSANIEFLASIFLNDVNLIFEEKGIGSDTITIKAPSIISASYELTLPVNDGDSNQFLQTNGSGALSWASGGSGTIQSGTDLRFAYYSGSGTTIAGTTNLYMSSNNIIVANHLYPDSTLNDLGNTTNYWQDLFVQDVNVTNIYQRSGVSGGSVDFESTLASSNLGQGQNTLAGAEAITLERSVRTTTGQANSHYLVFGGTTRNSGGTNKTTRWRMNNLFTDNEARGRFVLWNWYGTVGASETYTEQFSVRDDGYTEIHGQMDLNGNDIDRVNDLLFTGSLPGLGIGGTGGGSVSPHLISLKSHSSTPGPEAGQGTLFSKSGDGKLYWRGNLSGSTTEYDLTSSGGGGSVTSIVAGGGLSGGTITTTGTIALAAHTHQSSGTVGGTLSTAALTAGTLPVARGGTNRTSFTDKAVIITQDSGTDTLSAVAMDASGELLIGGTSGPAVATLSGGTNVTITNGNGTISIAAAGSVTSIATTSPIAGGTITGSGTITHVNTAGNKHIPTGGNTNEYLKYSASGTAVWAAAAGTGTVNTGVANRVAYYPSSATIVNDHASMTFAGGASPSAYEINIVDAVLDINGHTDSRIIIPVGTNKWAT